ncbi:DUF2860 domain-containing protein [Vibrio tubiashii]|uniref:DUF2860 domain-containing protein n=1 Tax=Vibrio tubiashii TaxID=29498 RepID=A0AAE5LI93_9VIBR|nr:DUF2860 domain-containing protein [Vibrio tubiashii]
MEKKLPITVSIFMTFLSFHSNSSEQGISGELGLFAQYQETKSNLSTGSDKALTSLKNEGASVSESSVFPLGNIQYQWGNHLVFIGQSEDTFVRGVLALELGYRNQINRNSSLSVAIAPTVQDGEVWSNPYLVNDKRAKTDSKGNVYRIKYEHQILTMDFAYYDRKIDTEASPNKALNREGKGYFSKLAISLPLSTSALIEPSVFYQMDDAQGSAMAFDKIGAGITASILSGHYTFVFDGRFSTSEYDATHPIFGVTREEDKLHLGLLFEEREIFGDPQMSLIAQITYEKSDANISFYDEEGVSFLIGGLYRF